MTVEGTYKYKQYELPAIPQIAGHTRTSSDSVLPRAALLIEDSKDSILPVNGGGNSYHSWLWNECKPGTLSGCRDFEQEGHQAGSYETVDPVYADEDIIRHCRSPSRAKMTRSSTSFG